MFCSIDMGRSIAVLWYTHSMLTTIDRRRFFVETRLLDQTSAAV
jgi:hypothetical protein